MLIHPVHAQDLATLRHRELIAQADAYRSAAHAGGPHPHPSPDCRVPAPGTPPGCRPDPRPASAGRVGRRRPRLGLRGHRVPHRVR